MFAYSPTACPTNATCNSTGLACGGGTKTVSFDLLTGTGSFKLQCRVRKGMAPTVTLHTFTGDDIHTFTDVCEDLWIEVSACNACSYNAFLSRR
jgi:hypothetical protein